MTLTGFYSKLPPRVLYNAWVFIDFGLGYGKQIVCGRLKDTRFKNRPLVKRIVLQMRTCRDIHSMKGSTFRLLSNFPPMAIEVSMGLKGQLNTPFVSDTLAHFCLRQSCREW